MVSAAISAAWEALAPGVSELELAAIAEHAARASGAEGFAFFAIVTSNGEIARRRYATDYRLHDGDLVFLDLGVVNGGYCAEFSRATVVGERVTAEQRGIFQAAHGANLALRERMRPGVMGSALDAAAREAIRATPYAAYEYRHVTITGIGVMLQERPIISNAADAGEDEPLQAGMVLNLEPGVYHPELGGLRAEDIVLVTDDGYKLLTPFPYDERLLTGR
jgi:Xaa-Pro aminopeptidase